MSKSMCNHSNWWIDCWIVPCSFGVKSLLLIKWIEAPKYTMNFFSLSLSTSFLKANYITRGTRFEEPVLILRIRPWIFAHVSCVKSKLISLPFLPCSRSFRYIFPRMLERLGFADVWLLSGWLQVEVPMFTFSWHTCSRDDEVSLGIGSRHPCMWRSSSAGMWIAIEDEFLFISRCSCVFVCTLVSEPSSAWWLGFCTFGNIQIITSCLPLAIFFRFTQSSLFAFHDRLQVLVCLFAFLSSLHFPSPFEFRCGEPVGESERDRPFRLPFCWGHAWMRMHLQMDMCLLWSNVCSPLYRSCCWHVLRLFLFASLRAPSYCTSVTISFSRIEMRIFDFLLGGSLGHQHQSATVVVLVAKCRLLSVNVQQIFQLFWLFNLHLVQNLQYLVSKSGSDCW